MAETAASANTEEKKEKTKGTTKSKNESTVVTEKFEDLALSAFKITINRVQQVAIKNLGGRVPTPAEQLALIAQRRKRTKESKVCHTCIWERVVF